MTLGEKIKKLRLENKMTQSELAEKLFITRQAITNYERDANKPGVETLVAMANLFKVELSYFVEEEKPIKKKWILPTIISLSATMLIAIIITVILLVTNNSKYYCVGFYVVRDENIELSIDEVVTESYCFDYYIYDKNSPSHFSNVNFKKYIPKNLGNLYYYEIYNKIGTNDYKMYFRQQINTNSSDSFKVLSKGKYYEDSVELLFITSTSSVSIISYNEYGEVILEETLTLDKNNKISSTLNKEYTEFKYYRVLGATRYYVKIESYSKDRYDVEKYNVLDDRNIQIFFFGGNYRKNSDYSVLFQI